MLVFFSKEGQELISEEKVDAVNIVTSKYVIKITKGGVNIARIEQSTGKERGLIPIYDKTLDLT